MAINPFLEERLNVDTVVLGASYVDEYNVEVVETTGDQEYRRLINPFPKRRFRLDFTIDATLAYANILNLYHKCFGRFKGFRIRCLDDFSTNGATGSPTHLDQSLVRVGTRQYQLRKIYNAGGERTLFKPVAGTTKIGVKGVNQTANVTVDTVTGIVTLQAAALPAVTAITKAANAVLTIGAHSFVTTEQVLISDVVGMTQINGLTGTITATGATTITVNINSTAFSTYTSGGRVEPINAITGGCEFDIPARFDTAVEVTQDEYVLRSLQGVEIVELINP